MDSEGVDVMTTRAALAAVDNRVTYRQVDYWIRCGWLRLAADKHGTGNYRVWSPAEVAALAEFVNVYETHRAMTEMLADGSVWADCLQRQRPRLVRGDL